MFCETTLIHAQQQHLTQFIAQHQNIHLRMSCMSYDIQHQLPVSTIHYCLDLFSIVACPPKYVKQQAARLSMMHLPTTPTNDEPGKDETCCIFTLFGLASCVGLPPLCYGWFFVPIGRSSEKPVQVPPRFPAAAEAHSAVYNTSWQQ